MAALNHSPLRAAPSRWAPRQRALLQTAELHGQPSHAMTEPSTLHEPPDERPWSANTLALHVERTLDDQGRPRISLVRHPTHPFPGELSGHDERFAYKQLFALAEDYLGQLARAIDADGPLQAAARSLEARQHSGFGWLGVATREGDEPDGRLSFVVEHRNPGDDESLADRTYVLLAGNQQQGADGRQVTYGGRIGLRVVAHVGPASQGRRPVRITGASFSAMDLAWTTQTEAVRIGKTTYHPRDGGFALDIFVQPIVQALAFDMLSIDGLALLPSEQALFLSGTAARHDKARRIYAWGVRIPLQRDDRAGVLFTDSIEVEQDYRIELASHLITTFERDPASSGPARTLPQRAPTRDGLGALRGSPAWLPAGAPTPFPLVLDDPANAGSRWVEVRETRVRHPGNTAVQAVPNAPGTPLPLRSDHLAAAHAWQRGTELFERITAYGLQPVQLFRLAKLPLVMRHHDRLDDANDGRAVNAQVRPDRTAPSASAPFIRAQLPLLEVTFGAACLTHWNIERGGARPEPLGLAADSRWAWHEFGHVLCYGSTGDIELPFAHSAGDALAAIVSDPDSGLQDDPARHITFPWVRTGRRHDRDALLGWCWCGRRNTRRQAGAQRRPMSFTSYFAEQLLSSSLFRAYESIGGATIGRGEQRRRASDYMVYLVMRGTALFGTANTVPASSADHFVSALIDADITTPLWQVQSTWGAGPQRPMRRVGGTVHKVIRWAFEQQGLYATTSPTAVVEGRGNPPDVDVHIPGQGERAEGGYAPVPLQWHDSAGQPWHAAPGALDWAGNTVTVTVRNRGSLPSGPVVVRVWTSGPGGLAWTAAAPVLRGSIPPGAAVAVNIGVANAPAPGSVVLAVVSCAADRANSDTAAGLPCAFAANTPPTDTERLLDIVANDNNMGLRVM